MLLRIERFHSFYAWVIFHCVYITHLLYSVISWWTLRLLPYLSYCKLGFNEHSKNIFLISCLNFIQINIQEWSYWIVVVIVLVVQSLSPVWIFAVSMDCSTPCFPVLPISQSLLRFMCIESVMPSNHLILCHPILLLPSIFPSIRVFSNGSVLCIRWPKY